MMNAQRTAEQSVHHFLAADAMAQSLGVTVSHVAPGEVTAHVTITDATLNGHGEAHGSTVFAVADIAFAMACNSHGQLSIGRSCQVEYFAPALPGDVLTAEAREHTLEGRTGIYDVTVRRQSDGALLAELRATSSTLPGSPPPPAAA